MSTFATCFLSRTLDGLKKHESLLPCSSLRYHISQLSTMLHVCNSDHSHRRQPLQVQQLQRLCKSAPSIIDTPHLLPTLNKPHCNLITGQHQASSQLPRKCHPCWSTAKLEHPNESAATTAVSLSARMFRHYSSSVPPTDSAGVTSLPSAYATLSLRTPLQMT